MTNPMDSGQDNYKSEKHLVEQIRKGDENAFERLFFKFFYDLCAYALQMTRSNEIAEDIVQEVFYKIWKGRRSWELNSSLKAYLFQSVRNEALNQINHEQFREDLRDEFANGGEKRIVTQESDPHQPDKKLLRKIWSIVSEMPQRRRSVFVLYRKHGLSYKEIAEVLGISRKTVENHMGLALNDIREQLDIELC